MKTIIAGGRDFTDAGLLWSEIEKLPWKITEVVCGTAQGADQLGRSWAIWHHVPWKEFPADWAGQGRAAGPIRNRQMAEYAEALIAFWDGRSSGTRNMIDEAEKRSLTVKVVQYGRV